MFQGLRGRLLLAYLIVMEAILILFSLGIYGLFSRSLSRQLDNKILTLAEIVAPTLSRVDRQGKRYLQYSADIPWQNVFNAKEQGIEWFDTQKRLLAHQGITFSRLPPEPGFLTIRQQSPTLPPIRTVTLFVSIDRSTFNQRSLQGYIRISQSLTETEKEQSELLWNLGITIIATLGLVTLGGFWLTQKAVEPLEESVEQLKQFTADASHELRGPLTAIKASIEVMQNHPERIHPKDVRKLGAIASATNQMAHLVQDLLFLARTEGAKMPSEADNLELSLNHLLEDLIEWLEPLAQEKEITLEYQELAKVAVMGDSGQLARLFSNLIQNALQYTSEKGYVIVRLSQHHRQARVTVEDTGIGIAPEDLPLVFNRFWRADKARSRREGGTGLGLAISQAIAQQHRGKITVSSELGVGTCFEVCLPINETKTLK
ncbi:histidine kinase [Rippkaea orientalis PCC 8801]|uniref:histidine kinase n=1 Tax=Rippkaea orientalis (strain PCC 8801 / RF-1) TaxID=41431 RepID=B7K4K7_RIPO1|nr:HAMP domain-containing sensor histidine kinase [Rippkaea orientalis]ACK65472.1 histidine kinase [Rippkaea orientalis PCC 8801]